MVSWWCHIWPRAPGLTSIIVHGITWIVAAFWPLAFIRVCLKYWPSPGYFSLIQREDTPVQVSYLWSPNGCNIWPRAPGLTSIMAQGITQIVAASQPPRVYWSLIRIMPPPPKEILTLECWRLPQLVLSPPFWFHYFSCQNALRRALIELKWFNKNCQTTPHLLCCTHRLMRFHLSSQKCTMMHFHWLIP